MSDESLFREVDEDVRRERAEKLWKQYGNYVVALSVGVILAVAGIKGWQYWQRTQAETAGAAYVAALDSAAENKAAEADKAFSDIAGGSHSGYARLARLQQASSLADAGKREEAVKAFDAIAADTGLTRPIRDMARIRAAYLLADSASLADLKSRVAGLDVATSSWRNAAREIIAIGAWRESKFAEANKNLQAILGDPQTSPGLRQRAQVFASLLKQKLPQAKTN